MPARPSLPGFDEPYRFDYPTLWLQVGGAALAVGCVVGYSWLAATSRGGEFSVEFGPEGLAVFLLAALVTILLHEGVHGLVARTLGYDVSFGVAWSMLAAYAAAFEQPISRRDNAVVAVAPLALLTPIGVALLPVADGPLLLAVVVGLVINTASAIGDCYLLYRLARLPRGSVLYDLSVDEMLIYEPLGRHSGGDG